MQYRDVGLIPESQRPSGEGNGNPLQYSCLGNPTDREVWWAIVHGVTRVRQDLATKQQQNKIKMDKFFWAHKLDWAHV